MIVPVPDGWLTPEVECLFDPRPGAAGPLVTPDEQVVAYLNRYARFAIDPWAWGLPRGYGAAMAARAEWDC